MELGRLKLRLGLCVCVYVLGGCLLSSTIMALELDPKELRSESEPRSVSILQNRYFIKNLRPEVSINAGIILNEAYLNTYLFGLRVGTFFGEIFGVELEYFGTSISDSNDRKTLADKTYRHPTEDRVVKVLPETVKIESGWSIEGVASPFYGKINIANKLIVYSDIHLSLGIGQLRVDKEFANSEDGTKIDHEKGSKWSFNLGIGERFYIKKFMSIRIDVKDRIFDNGKKTQHSIASSLGLSYFFL